MTTSIDTKTWRKDLVLGLWLGEDEFDDLLPDLLARFLVSHVLLYAHLRREPLELGFPVC